MNLCLCFSIGLSLNTLYSLLFCSVFLYQAYNIIGSSFILMLQSVQLVKHCDIMLPEQQNSISPILYTRIVSSENESLWSNKREHVKSDIYSIQCLIFN